MREEDSNWFSKWEEELPSPEELTPISQTLISRDLAAAFDIQSPVSNANFGNSPFFNHQTARSSPNMGSGDFDSSSGGGSDEPARTLKRPRLVWTPQLHKRFVDAVAHLGIKNAVPKTIMQLMSVDGLTRENVASHLQKYRLYLKRMQGINNGGGGGSGGGSGDSATDHLFASAPVPAHFLHPQSGAGGYVPALRHQQQVAAMVAGGQYHSHRQMGQFDYQARQTQMGPVVQNSVAGFVKDLDSGSAANGRKVLTLFPSAEN